MEDIPIVLFAYARPALLERTLACLRAERVPLIHVFADGAKGAADATAVAETRAMLRRVDWADVRLVERERNFGLGRNVLAGVGAVAAEHEMFMVWEDDLVCAPGTWAWLDAALRHYAADERVMSVTAWTHPRVTPTGQADRPYLDGRAECWVWGAYARSWRGMDETALGKLRAAGERGVETGAYGADLARMAHDETRRNLWAVRWIWHHLQHGGLCVRPPWPMVEHIGIDDSATNVKADGEWSDLPLRAAPPIPSDWPEAVEHPACGGLWRAAYPTLSRWAACRLAARRWIARMGL